MQLRSLGRSDLQVFPLCLGGNVFGWTADETNSFAVLDEYTAAGGNFIDTADVYSTWVPGHSGGESESILGRWMKARGNRSQVVIATKAGGGFPNLPGLSAQTIRASAEASLRRLQVDVIDLYYAHRDDPKTDLHETMRAFDALVREGKVRYIAASNYSAPRLAEALAIASRDSLARFVALQPHYNLMHRSEYEGALADLCAREGLACVPYFALAKGFLTGKYRAGSDVDSPRAAGARAYLDDRGVRVLDTLTSIARTHDTTPAAVALAWLAAQPTVAAPIASARNGEQLRDLLPVASLTLSADEISALSSASV
jgi:aryl-alcohol dehydrogenase-like predicted oxidoreductase